MSKTTEEIIEEVKRTSEDANKLTNKKEWFWYEDNSGWPIYHLGNYKQGNKVPTKTINIGDKLVIMSFTGFVEATVTEQNKEGQWYAESADCIFPLEFNFEKDYFVCFMSMHKKALKKIKEVNDI